MEENSKIMEAILSSLNWLYNVSVFAGMLLAAMFVVNGLILSEGLAGFMAWAESSPFIIQAIIFGCIFLFVITATKYVKRQVNKKGGWLVAKRIAVAAGYALIVYVIVCVFVSGGIYEPYAFIFFKKSIIFPIATLFLGAAAGAHMTGAISLKEGKAGTLTE